MRSILRDHRTTPLTVVAACLCLAATPGLSDGGGSHDEDAPIRADGHAPIGVMGDHMHKAGEVMVSYRVMRMNMEGNRDGTSSLSSDAIVTTVPNRFFGAPMQPPALRVVPTEMTMDMHMVGVMYAPTDWLTLMAMGAYTVKEMDHITFAGGAGTTRLGAFTTKTSGFGDTKLSGMVRVLEDDRRHLHLNVGISLPTGSITETDDILTPMGGTPTVRLPYAMQLGSGTFDLLPGVTYTGRSDAFAWGAQAMGVIRLGRNDEGYALGDEALASLWGSYAPAPWISFSLRGAAKTVGAIDGIDDRIVAPVQTADPDNYGGETIDIGLGVNLAGQEGILRGHRIAAELALPAYRDLNGPQMETDWTLTIGYQFAF